MAESLFQGIGGVQAFHKGENSFELSCKHGRVRVTALTDGIVRVRATQASEFGPDFSYAIAKTLWPKLNAAIQDGPKTTVLRTKKLVVKIQKSPLRITFTTSDGRRLNG